MTALRRALQAYAAPAAAAYWLLLFGTGVTATILYAIGPALAWLGGMAAGLVSCVCCGCIWGAEPPGLRAVEALHYVATAAALFGVAVAAGWLVGRLSPRWPGAIAWAVGLAVVADGALTLGLPPATPDWVALLQPVFRVPTAWYLPTMWYQMEPLLDATRLGLVIPALLVGARIGASQRPRDSAERAPVA